MTRDDARRFREVQRLREPVLWFVVGTAALLLVAVGLAEPMVLPVRVAFVVLGVGAVALLWATRLVVEVHPDAVTVSVGPLGSLGSRRVLPAEAIESAGPRASHVAR